MKKEHKFSKNGQNFLERCQKYIKIREICQVFFVNFCEFCSTKISLETLFLLSDWCYDE